jgi:hypothetical protein
MKKILFAALMLLMAILTLTSCRKHAVHDTKTSNDIQQVQVNEQSVRSTEQPFQITEQPVGYVYSLNQTATPLRAIFRYHSLQGFGKIDSDIPIKLQWYWSSANSNTDRTNGLGESVIAHDLVITNATTLTPATNVAGVRYYYAVIRYAELVTVSHGVTKSELREAVTVPAKIEVR